MKLILGLGKTGVSIARFLTKQQVAFRVADNRNTPPFLSQFKGQFNTENLFLGDWKPELLNNIDEVIISPGVAQSETIVIWARANNIPIISDIALFSRHAQAPIIGITGSNGKSTVTQLLGEMIANDGKKVAIGGNIGKPALDCLSDEIDYYVLELSSYQLDYTQNLELLTGVVLNITPDHLDRYPGFQHYVSSKLSLYQYCQHPVINADEPLTPTIDNAKYFGMDIPKQDSDFGTVTCHGSCYILKGDDSLMDVDDMLLIGQHNIVNALAALALGDQIGLNTDSMITTVKTFKGLEHRLEWVVKKQNIDYYNDSKATNAMATITALNALIDKYENIVLIAGGIKKQEDYSALFELIDNNISNVVLIGQSAKELGNNIHTAKVTYTNSMEAAVNTASTLIDSGAILLSPACTSFDMFDNFEQRGRVFKQCIAEF
ncbi:UDP-N-acetylmuramoyl-L-alanine--D-glutamateligase (EC 6.3.2.9) [uncultured Gammaproteobacteria bacterium]|jgi:UDP-N-acetylmuramoylalanine--D-glutamate ligase|uniref:UDP-N-acetylmuramoyl-L-alanine--D-glutamate ligase n=1 Tax=thiotrophic endosymbiont of Bathymodiolus puteoserpentis (Logatchev) TaxID=343240 RepID=UPI0010B50B28|nr:UDP-N-acetylmuramoyl-L-alanine--D-glutamate ligase [thiotrophic endosymbiont of Bathymodiolus puteoserpentis (Logatchev)]CAC9639531.1 UDP-N-acetylmuramoyl-L-alanine--D-glutamateligase (EC 6.3.2.9) [uncultured Gammaproteobacteria bacterium]CAC9651214.1 UDP-N-acetylmuramoyl-L-alanine--D-glutamateligase (EC 6.3.2.9) [uncultured Gammaproteobacteria bacterium]CAC9984632.1 UDP-N-acetylmuramoylalanine--D-glutamate ligase (EC 6.3.2.9) [uncultured Gammaproteobacteria bacterium]SSC11030.1 UDP-N-acetyl